jgi:hypothetical protein
MLKGKAWKGSANTKNLLLWFILQISYISKLIYFYQDVSLLFINAMSSAGFTYRLDRLKPRFSKFRGPPAKVYNIFNTVIGLSLMLSQRTVLLKQPFSNFPYTVALHFRILQTFKHPSSFLPLLKLIKKTSIFFQSWRWGIGRGLTSGLA